MSRSRQYFVTLSAQWDDSDAEGIGDDYEDMDEDDYENGDEDEDEDWDEDENGDKDEDEDEDENGDKDEDEDEDKDEDEDRDGDEDEDEDGGEHEDSDGDKDEDDDDRDGDSDQTWTPEDWYFKPPPKRLQFDPRNGFLDFFDWLSHLPTRYPNSPVAITNRIASYRDANSKRAWEGSIDSEADKERYSICTTVLQAASTLPSRGNGTIGVVCSPISSAMDIKQGTNNWHTVGFARRGPNVWIHDPAFRVVPQSRRIRDRPMINMARLMVGGWKEVKFVYIQGPPAELTVETESREDCMARSAQWIEDVVKGSIPWPPSEARNDGQQPMEIAGGGAWAVLRKA